MQYKRWNTFYCGPQSDLCKDVLSVCKQLQITAATENVLTDDTIIDVIFYKNIRKL